MTERSDGRPLILLTNDDGVHAAGLRALRLAAASVGDVVIVAPTREQSAQSHALTLDRPLRHIEHEKDVHSIDGTPADCVYLALFEPRFLPRPPDIVLSGINHGHNLGTSVFYSGTVAAAREAASRGIPALAFSAPVNADLQSWLPTVASLARAFAQCAADVSSTPLLNVNLPSAPSSTVRVTRVGRQVYEERVIPRIDPNGREYFWIGGRVTEGGEAEGTDAHAIALGYVSVTPLALDSTNADHWETAARVSDAANALSREGDML